MQAERLAAPPAAGVAAVPGGGRTLRAATAADQDAIVALIHTVGINPMGLHWPHFLVIEEDGRIIACGQLKPHRDCVELASIAVRPDRQGQGLGSAIVWALLARAQGPLYLTCQRRRQGYYERFGFVRIGRPRIPASFGPVYIVGGLISLLMPVRYRLTFMWRPAPAAAPAGASAD